MNRNIRNIVLSIFSIGLLSACGGGSSNSDAFDGSANTRYDGKWAGVCEFDTDFFESDIYSITIDGTKATIDFETYPTSDCTGNTSDEGQIVYALDFVGTQNPSTGVCEVDDQINTTIISAKANGISLTSSQLNFIAGNAIEAGGFPEFILLCVNPDGDTLYAFDEASGDGTTEANRPNQIDLNESVSRQ